jgi:ketosteroid isomerase-like protein
MKRIAFALVLMVVAAGCPAAQSKGPVEPAAPPTSEEVVTAIKARLEQYRQAYEVRSMEAIEPLYAHDDSLVVTAQGKTQHGWMQVQEQLGGFLEKCVLFKVRMSDVAVTALGDGGALATATLHRTYGDGVKTVDEIGTLMLVFRRAGSDWLIVAEHYSYAAVAE